jgi:hypothetical protein
MEDREKELANEIAKILNDSGCLEEAIKFSNANDSNNGAYLGFIAGAHFIIKNLKEIGKL